MKFDRLLFEDTAPYKTGRKIKQALSAFYHCFLKGECLRLYKNRENELFEVPIEICINALGFSYGRKGWHYLTALLKEYENNKELKPQDSVLNKFHTVYQPKSAFDFIDGEKGCWLPIGVYPWESFYVKESGSGGRPKDLELARFCGPSDFKLITRDFRQVIEVYNDIKNRGYRPWFNKDGFVSGCFLVNKSKERRFIVLDGNHRVAALSALGYESVTVRYTPGCYHEINEQDVDNWYYVRTGRCAKGDALKYFYTYFEVNGLERATKLGLITDLRG